MFCCELVLQHYCKYLCVQAELSQGKLSSASPFTPDSCVRLTFMFLEDVPATKMLKQEAKRSLSNTIKNCTELVHKTFWAVSTGKNKTEN